ncbi:uncharacterized protein LOC120344765 [Styela clava]
MATRQKSRIFDVSNIFSPSQGRRKLIRIDGEFGTPIENILHRRPSVAAAMLSSWNTSTSVGYDFQKLRNSLSQNDMKSTNNFVYHKPPHTPLSSRRQCHTSKLSRRNAMTRADVRLAKLKYCESQGHLSQVPSSERVECLVIPNPILDSVSTNSKSQMKASTKAEFAYFSNASWEDRKRSIQHTQQQIREIKRYKRSPSFFKNLITKLKPKRRGDGYSMQQNNMESMRSENFLTLWQNRVSNDIDRTKSTSRMCRGKLSSPVTPRVVKRTFTDSRLRGRRPSQESLSMGYCLKTLLQDKKFSKNFHDFLVGEFSEENLDFWLDCESYKKKKEEKLKKNANKIYNQYLVPGTLKEVNVDSEIRARVECELFNPRRTTFDQAQNQIYKLMMTDSFPRYLEISRILQRNEYLAKFNMFQQENANCHLNNMKKYQSSSNCRPKWKSADDFIYVDSLLASSIFAATRTTNQQNMRQRSSSRHEQRKRLVRVCPRARSSTPTRRRMILKNNIKSESTYVSIDILNKKISEMEEGEKRTYTSNWYIPEKSDKKNNDVNNGKIKHSHRIAVVCKRAKSAFEKIKSAKRRSNFGGIKTSKPRLSSALSGSVKNIIAKQLIEAGIKGNSATVGTTNVICKRKELCIASKALTNEHKMGEIVSSKKSHVARVAKREMKTVKSCDNILLDSSAQTKIPDMNLMFSVAHFGSFNESNQKKTNLQDTLSDEDGLKNFRKFLRSEFSEENLDFWIRCVAYKRIKSPRHRWQESRQIYNEFLAPNAPKEVNLDSRVKQNVKRNIECPNEFTFDEAKCCVFYLMETDSFRRFSKSRRHSIDMIL